MNSVSGPQWYINCAQVNVIGPGGGMYQHFFPRNQTAASSILYRSDNVQALLLTLQISRAPTRSLIQVSVLSDSNRYGKLTADRYLHHKRTG